ncbi:MAG: peptide transporter [Flavobacteriales bacterium]|nr:peptide transporter [Flavobacteriales bacterium]
MKYYNSLNKIALNKLLSNKLACLALLVIIFFFFISIFAYQITPDKTPFANSIELSIAKKNPCFEVDYILLKSLNKYKRIKKNSFFLGNTKKYDELLIKDYKLLNDTLYYHLYSNPLEKKAISTSNLKCNNDGSYVKTRKFLLGTDKYGRDLLSRVILGTRVSFSVGFISVFISIFIGLILGLLSGYYRGKVDIFICWLINVVWSIPTLMLVIAISLVLGKGFWQVFVAVGLTMWVEVARVTRGEVLKVSRLPYIESVKSFGLSDFKIMFKHILPNIINPIIIISAANFATSVLLESGLSFLGIGVQPPVPSWGMIIRNHYGFIVMEKIYLSLVPGLCIVFLVLAFMILANSLRDILDNKLENN